MFFRLPADKTAGHTGTTGERNHELNISDLSMVLLQLPYPAPGHCR